MLHAVVDTIISIGVSLEHGTDTKSNNTLITVTVDNIGVALFCLTDREDCCNDDFNNTAGDWFLPNASKITASSDTQPLHISFGNRSVGLNFNFNTSNISPELPVGIYYCKMSDM